MASIHWPALKTYLATAGPKDRSKFSVNKEPRAATISRPYMVKSGEARNVTRRLSEEAALFLVWK